MTTIKALADELGVTKQAVRRHINKLPPNSISTGDNREILINDDGANKIRDSINQNRGQVTTKLPPTIDTIVDTLTKQLEQKDIQIAALQQSLNDTTEALKEAQKTARAAQALHYGTMQEQLMEPAPAGAGAGADQPAQQPEPEPQRKGLFARLFSKK